MSRDAHSHGPENAEHELRKAYYCVIEAGTTHFWDGKGIVGVSPDEVVTLYKQAFNSHRQGDRLAAERWARTAKHLARAFESEAKIAYLEPRATELPYLEGASAEEYNLYAHSDTAEDLLNSVAPHIVDTPDISRSPVAFPPDLQKRYLSRARRHLEVLRRSDYRNELLRAERIKAAHEYGRVLECMALAFEAESMHPKSAA